MDKIKFTKGLNHSWTSKTSFGRIDIYKGVCGYMLYFKSVYIYGFKKLSSAKQVAKLIMYG